MPNGDPPDHDPKLKTKAALKHVYTNLYRRCGNVSYIIVHECVYITSSESPSPEGGDEAASRHNPDALLCLLRLVWVGHVVWGAPARLGDFGPLQGHAFLHQSVLGGSHLCQDENQHCLL